MILSPVVEVPIARYADLAHEVVALSLTCGDSESIAASLHMPPQELAAKRYADAQRSCALLHCRMVALHYINRGTEVTMVRYQEFGDALLDHKPDIVFTHWPIDTHPITGQLLCSPTTRGCVAERSFRCTSMRSNWVSRRRTSGRLTTWTSPTWQSAKKSAAYANALTVGGLVPLHEQMQRSRGNEKGCKFAEAFNRHPQSPNEPASLLP